MFHKKCHHVIVVFLLLCGAALAQEQKLARELLIQDTRELAEILEAAHPDPYSFGGGKIEFHRRMQKVLLSIPPEGLTPIEFYKLLLPFVAAVGDGHTTLWRPSGAHEMRPGIPLALDVVEQTIYVSAVFRQEDQGLLGARLLAVEGVPFSGLAKRSGEIKGWDGNEYNRLTNLCLQLQQRETLELLLPEWKKRERIQVTLDLPSGRVMTVTFPLDGSVKPERSKAIRPPSKLAWRPQESSPFDFWFLDPEKKVGLLRITRMWDFRENFEDLKKNQVPWAETATKEAYERLHGKKAPESFEEALAAIPSAQEAFHKMGLEMAQAQARALIVDLRGNPGGNDLLSDLLLEELFGGQQFWPDDVWEGQIVIKHSELMHSQRAELGTPKTKKQAGVPLSQRDYEFLELRDFAEPEPEPHQQDQIAAPPPRQVTYRPERVIVVSSAWTYSAAFDLLLWLYRFGAHTVGVPSGQAANCFGDVLEFTLKNSGLAGGVSYKQFLFFPNDPEKGRVLRPHRELTYDHLKKWNFDPHAGILLALEELKAP